VGARLVALVSAYRAQQGTTAAPAPRPFHHFFVESIRDLSEAARGFRAAGAPTVQPDFSPDVVTADGALGLVLLPTVQLDFSPDVPNYPTAGIFPGDVFDRVLLGFRATLHLQLGSVGA
jgi:hypothetical protein